jgi:hypothetical protein
VKFYGRNAKDGGNGQNNALSYNRSEYYDAYYALMGKNMLNSIPTLEAQVAFIRNILPLMVMYIITRCGKSFCDINLWFGALIILAIGIILVIMLTEHQKEIYWLAPLTILYIIALCCCCYCWDWSKNCCRINSCCAAIILLTIGAILLTMIQNKIYYLVWEGNEYLKKSQDEPQNQSQNESPNAS